MSRWLIVGGAAVGAVVLARRLAPSCGGFDFAKMIERMPDEAPPKWMYLNISAIRANTERTLQLLEEQRAGSGTTARTAA